MPDIELVTRLLRDLTHKVDQIPDRHELNAIVEPIKERLESQGADIEELKRGRLPSWLAPVGTAISALMAVTAVAVALNHPIPTQAASQPTPTPAIELRTPR
jgi:hypothetical protein